MSYCIDMQVAGVWYVVEHILFITAITKLAEYGAIWLKANFAKDLKTLLVQPVWKKQKLAI